MDRTGTTLERTVLSLSLLSETGPRSVPQAAPKSQDTLLPQTSQGLDNSCEPPQIDFLFDM